MVVVIGNIWIWTSNFKAFDDSAQSAQRNARSNLIEWNEAASVVKPELRKGAIQCAVFQESDLHEHES